MDGTPTPSVPQIGMPDSDPVGSFEPEELEPDEGEFRDPLDEQEEPGDLPI